MTHLPTSHDEAYLHPRPEGRPAFADAVQPATAVEMPMRPSAHVASVDPTGPIVLDQSGRALGPRALLTRARILEATIELLEEKSLRELRVIDIARRIGSSPATFYQYFKDVRDVALELATQVTNSIPDLVDVIAGDWTGTEGHERGCRLANLVIDYWEEYAPVLRLRNTAADEGDDAFAKIRMNAMLPLVTAFMKVLEKSRAARSQVDPSYDEKCDNHLHPISTAMVMVTGLEAMAVHRKRFEKRFGPQGEMRQQIVDTMATMLQMVLTSGR